MGLFDQFPYTNFHELNLMWILEALKEIKTTTEQFVAINSLKYADPIQWNIVSQYEKNTIVIDPQTGTAYISVQPVPTGVALTNEDYWTVVFDLGSFVTRAAKNFTTRWEADTTLTATFNSVAGDWLVWGDTLYVANVNITAGDSYVVEGNIHRITIEEVKNQIYDTMGSLNNLNTTDKSNLVAAINEVLTTLVNTAGDLNDLDTLDKSNLVAAINEVADQVLGKIGDLDDLETTDKTNLVAAINENTADILARYESIGFLNAKDFGAAGDGITDDYVALQNWLNAVGTTGKLGILPEGTYVNNTQTLTFRENSGVNSVNILGIGNVVLTTTNTEVQLALLDLRYVQSGNIQNINFDCLADTRVMRRFGIYLMDCSNLNFQNIDIKNVSYCGILCFSDSGANYQRNLHFNNISIHGSGKTSVDNTYPEGAIFENVLDSNFNNIFVENVCYYPWEFKDYCYNDNISNLAIYNTRDGIYLGGNAAGDDVDPPTGYYCQQMNFDNVAMKSVDYPIQIGWTQHIRIKCTVVDGNRYQCARIDKSRMIDIEFIGNPSGQTQSILHTRGASNAIYMKILGRYYPSGTFTLIDNDSTDYNINLDLMGDINTSGTKIANVNSQIYLTDWNDHTRYNYQWTDGTL